MLRLGTTLFIVTAVMAAALGLVYGMTKDTIAGQEQEKLLGAVGQVLGPEADPAKTEEIKAADGSTDYFVARDSGGAVVGYAVPCSAKGYSSVISVMAGIDTEGMITGTTVLSQNETPGLGTRIQEVKVTGTVWSRIGGLFSDEPAVEAAPAAPWYQVQYAGLSAPELELVKGATADPAANQVEAITGATISSRAFTKAVREGITAFLARADLVR